MSLTTDTSYIFLYKKEVTGTFWKSGYGEPDTSEVRVSRILEQKVVAACVWFVCFVFEENPQAVA